MSTASNRTFNFNDSLKAGQAAEDQFHLLFPHLERLDGRLADFKTPSGKLVELKSDFYDHSKTENHFIEVYSYDEKPGGPFQSESNDVDYFAYWHPKTGEVYLYYVNDLCGHLRTVKGKDDLIEVKNKSHTTRGWKVPRRDLEHLKLDLDLLRFKNCSVCKQSKILIDFYTDKRSTTGRTPGCKECIRRNYEQQSIQPEFKQNRAFLRNTPEAKEKRKAYFNKPELKQKLAKRGRTSKQRYNQLAHKARMRNSTTTLSFEQFDEIIRKPCTYCKTITFGLEAGCGIDRINSAIGYVEGNVTSCCKTCNMAKGTLSIGELLLHIKKMVPNLEALVDEQNKAGAK